MSILNSSVNKKISVKLSLNEINEIKLYIKGAVDGFCNINNGETFSVRRLFGGDNGNWNGTPLQAIYNYYVSVGADNAKEKSAIDVGVLLKQVLSDDVYWEYELIKGYTNEYRRIGRNKQIAVQMKLTGNLCLIGFNIDVISTQKLPANTAGSLHLLYYL